MQPVRVLFLWHMHQPSYRDPLDGVVVLPWVRLHALKDYLGMVRLLDDVPEVRVTFNLVPCLVDQVEALVRGDGDDPLQRVTRKPAESLDEGERVLALKGFFQAHRQNLVGRFPRLVELLEKRGAARDEAALAEAARRFSSEDLRDLQLVAKLAWFDLDWQASDPVVRGLVEKGRGFSEEDKLRLAEREEALLGQILPAYRRAAERGQVELSTSPYYHPILPLLSDSAAHHEAHPGAPLPRRYRHPEDAADQVRRAVARHAAVFGAPPAGLWPSEGSVSDEAVLEMARAGIRWTASDEGVLERSIGRPLHRDSRGTAHPLEVLYTPWVRRTAAGDVAMVFRDRALSDLIGFSYAGMDPEHAAHDMLDRFRRVGERWRAQGLPGAPLVSVILDGENAWEYFREGGRVFLARLYRGLAEDPALEAVTVSQALETAPQRELPRVFAGSWIHADFSVWIGHADDRRAWDLLGEARDALDRQAERVTTEALEKAWEAFRAACGSDWCWWYGEEHHSENDFEFDRLFRRHLQAVYVFLGLAVPEALGETLITTRRLEVRHSRPTGAVEPTLDGRISRPDEWVAAGVHRVPLVGNAMRRGSVEVRALRFGLGAEQVHLLVETAGPARALLGRCDVVLSFPGPTALRYRVGARGAVRREERTGLGWVAAPTSARAAAEEFLEASVPISELRPAPGRRVEFRVVLLQGEVEVERHPETGPIEVSLEEVTRG
ncbi:MAG: glycoside hydrolase [Acidobacteria bacterium]|nr:glycoside hydrolase [Acidobacteriota bacterium]